jgi:hypothetical protein
VKTLALVLLAQAFVVGFLGLVVMFVDAHQERLLALARAAARKRAALRARRVPVGRLAA